MINNVIELKNFYDLKGGRLTSLAADYPFDEKGLDWRRPAVIIVPGGAYSFCSKREGEPVGFRFLANGYNVFILDYLCEPEGVYYPEQLLELACAVDYVRKNAESYNTNPDEIFAVGFSAGGHLTASLASDYKIAKSFYPGEIDPKLSAAGLIYPVISDLHGHCASHENLFVHAPEGYKDKYFGFTRTDECVCEDSCPAYIFSTFEDSCVSALNSLKYAEALKKQDIPFEIHIFKDGDHGMATADNEINNDNSRFSRNQSWTKECADFFRSFCKESF